MKRGMKFNQTYFDLQFKIYKNDTKKVKNQIKNIDSLVFAGGGMRGIDYSGVYLALKNYGILNNIKTIVGVSAGSICSFLHIAGFTPEEIVKVCIKMDYTKTVSPKVKNLYYGSLDNGNRMIKLLEKFLILKKIDPKISMKQFYELSKIKFIIGAYNSTKEKMEYLDYTNNPDLSIITALRMSSAIPVYFKPVKYNDNFYRDGGIADDFPINYLPDLNKVIGFKFEDSIIEHQHQDNLESGIINLINAVNLRGKTLLNDKKKYFVILQSEVSTLEFDADSKKKQLSIKKAYIYTLKYLNKRFNEII